MNESLFREYDLRGKVGTELVLDNVYALGRALGYYFIHQEQPVKTVALGMDGRIHSHFIAQELSRAFQDSGLHVVCVGLCPTPVLYFSLHTLPVEAGVMVTASHNTKEYNGIKICLGKNSVWGAQIQELKRLYNDRKEHRSLYRGSYREYPMVKKYTQWLVNRFEHLKHKQFSLAFDCGNGAAGVVLPELIKKLYWKNPIIYATIDGNFPNHDPDPVCQKNMQGLCTLLRDQKLDCGIGFDGDGDRMVPYTSYGQAITGDKLIILFAREILAKRPGSTIVYDIKCSALLPNIIRGFSGNPCVMPSGHSIIKDAVKKYNAPFAGELSCHFFFHDRYFGYDDGIYAALRFCELLDTYKSVDQLLQACPHSFSTPEIRITCAQEEGRGIIRATHKFFAARQDVELCTLDGVRATLPYGWGLVRSSNTQPALCLRFESTTAEGLEKVKEDFYTALKSHIDPLILQASLNESI